MVDPIMTITDMIAGLEKRIEKQRLEGGTIMDYGTPDPLDVSALATLKTFTKLRDTTFAASTKAEAAFEERHPERGGLIGRLLSHYRFSTVEDRHRAHEVCRAISSHPMVANPATALAGPYPELSPFGAVGKTGSPLAYLIDPGAGSGSDHVTRFWPGREQLDDITRRGGDITPLYANGNTQDVIAAYERAAEVADYAVERAERDWRNPDKQDAVKQVGAEIADVIRAYRDDVSRSA